MKYLMICKNVRCGLERQFYLQHNLFIVWTHVQVLTFFSSIYWKLWFKGSIRELIFQIVHFFYIYGYFGIFRDSSNVLTYIPEQFCRYWEAKYFYPDTNYIERTSRVFFIQICKSWFINFISVPLMLLIAAACSFKLFSWQSNEEKHYKPSCCKTPHTLTKCYGASKNKSKKQSKTKQNLY